jgi:ABC-type polysaccharide/polyol phosphate transport system ATPase subunit
MSQLLQKRYNPDELVIRAENLSKAFSIRRSRHTLFKSLKNILTLGISKDSSTVMALKDVNFEVSEGEWIGLIGNNGSGKSTLLKLLAELYMPTDGKIYISGTKSLVTGYGLGMIDELTVRDNTFLYGAMYGLENREVEENIAEIIEWAELTDFVGAKLKTLSSGMRTRLAFSITRYINSDICLYDEALSAGDKDFKQKCEDFFYKSKNSHNTFVIASHDLTFIKKFCDKTIWLHKGIKMAFDETQIVLKSYDDFK